MPSTVALLGATGKTGREILTRLLQREDVKLQIYARSRSKLFALFPDLTSDGQVSIFSSAIDDVENMTRCLDGADRIIFALGENNDFVGSVHIIEAGALSVVDGLTELRLRQKGWQRPRLLMLSSATWNETLSKNTPNLVH